MAQREFANQRALIDYAEQNGLACLWEGMPAFAKRQRPLSPLPAFTKRQQQLSPEQYEIVDVRTSRGMRRAMLFPRGTMAMGVLSLCNRIEKKQKRAQEEFFYCMNCLGMGMTAPRREPCGWYEASYFH